MRRFKLLCALAMPGLVLAACESAPTNVERFGSPQFLTIPTPTGENVRVCKAYVGNVVADSFTFTGTNTNALIGNPFKVAAETCRTVRVKGADTIRVTVVEQDIPLGIQLDSVVIQQFNAGTITHTNLGAVTTGSVYVGGSPRSGGNIIFYNSVTPDEGEGCTPGYWKQAQHFDSWTTYTSGQSLESVFDVPDSFGLDNTSLVDALSFTGGSGTLGAARILLRAAVASLLNSTSAGVSFPQTTADIIADVNTALASGDRGTMLTLAGELDADNNLGCTLN